MSVFANNPYNHEQIRNFILAFGEMFSGITIVKKDTLGAVLQSSVVPIDYANKNKWITRIRESNDLTTSQVRMTLPRLAYEIVDYQYAPSRKIGVNGTYAIGNIAGMTSKIFPPTPYDIIIELYLISKDNKDEGFGVLEQIIPYFQPYLIMNFEILKEFAISKDVPVTFQSYREEDTYGGSPEDMRTVTKIFTFAAQMDFFGPVLATTDVIKEVIVDINSKLANIDVAVNPTTATIGTPYTIVETITEKM